MTLDKVNRGSRIEILSIPDQNVRAQAIRLGVYEGASLTCFEKISSGPVILKNRFQEIAIGLNIAKQIKVKECKED